MNLRLTLGRIILGNPRRISAGEQEYAIGETADSCLRRQLGARGQLLGLVIIQLAKFQHFFRRVLRLIPVACVLEWLLQFQLARLDDLALLRGRRSVQSLDLLNSFVARQDRTEDDMLAVQMRCRHGRKEELRPVRVLAGVRHAQEALALVLRIEVLVVELLSVDALSASTSSASTDKRHANISCENSC